MSLPTERPLIVCPGVDGYRLAYAGPSTFEEVISGLTWDEAVKLMVAARGAQPLLPGAAQ